MYRISSLFRQRPRDDRYGKIHWKMLSIKERIVRKDDT